MLKLIMSSIWVRPVNFFPFFVFISLVQLDLKIMTSSQTNSTWWVVTYIIDLESLFKKTSGYNLKFKHNFVTYISRQEL
jgi:hypothetical protein